MKESELIEKFKKQLIQGGIPEKSIRTAAGNKSKIMDFNFIIPVTNTLISLEAKTFNDSRTNSNFFLSLFGKVIKGRKLNKLDAEYKTFSNIEYGFLFDDKNMNIISKLLSVIQKCDWELFCKMYDLKHIYIVNDDKYKVMSALKFIDSATKIDEYFIDKNIIENSEDIEE